MNNDKLIESLRGCSRGDYLCIECVGNDGTKIHYHCQNRLLKTAADALENAQHEAAALRADIDKLRGQLETVTRERDAAVEELKQSIFSETVNSCDFCSHANPDKSKAPYCLANFCENDEWEWHGVQEEQNE